MDAVDREKFARITRVPDSFNKVLAGVRAARRAGLDPVKVNCVLLRGFNEDQIVEFAKFSREEGVIVRFIEFMPLEEDRVWTPEVVVRLEEILAALNSFQKVVPLAPNAASETALRYTFEDGVGEMGIIAPVSHPFCGHCSRVRLTSDGKLRTCLFSQFDHDLYGVVRRGGDDAALAEFIRRTVDQKEARHHIGEAGLSEAFAQHGAYRRITWPGARLWNEDEGQHGAPGTIRAGQPKFPTCFSGNSIRSVIPAKTKKCPAGVILNLLCDFD